MHDPSQSVDTAAAEKQLVAANAALAEGDVDGALAALKQAIEADPYHEELPLLAATIQLRQGDPIHAAHLAMDALAVRPFYPQALDVLGVSYIEALQPEKAEKILRVALRCAPASKNAASNLRDARKRKKEIKRAAIPKKELLRATAILPEKRVKALLDRNAPTLSVVIVASDGDADAIRTSIDSVADQARQTIVVDARGGEPYSAEGVATIAVDPTTSSAARLDAGLRRASCDWVLWLDAGETLDGTSPPPLDDDEALAFALELRDPTGVVVREPRLVRNAAGLRARGHRRPTLTAGLAALERQWGLAIRDADPRISTPRALTIDLAAPVDPATVAAVEKELAADTTDPQARLERAELWLAADEPGRALELLQPLRRELSRDERRARRLDLDHPTTLHALALHRLQRHDEMRALLDDYHGTYGATANTRWLEALAALQAGDRDGARAHLSASEGLLTAPGYGPLLAEVHAGDAATRHGLLLLEAGEARRARQVFEAALERDPGNVDARLGRLTAEMAGGEIEEVLQGLDALIRSHGEERKVWIAGDILMRQVPALAPTTVEWLNEALERLPKDDELRLRLAEAQLRCGRVDDARAAWNDAGSLTPRLSARIAAAIAADESLPEIPGGDPEAVVNEVVGWYRTWLHVGAVETLDRALVRTAALDEQLPGLAARTVDWLESCGQGEAARRLQRNVGGEA